jgi:DNA-binding XRE family transcriptional regulator
VGAYEEGRAEAKLEVITKIAKYFSITVDDLVNKEITVNKLYHFNIFDDKYGNKINLGAEILKKVDFTNIPLIISHELLVNQLTDCIKTAENHITLPHHNNNHLAVLIDRGSFRFIPSAIVDHDIIVLSTDVVIDNNTNLSDKLWLIKTNKTLYLGEIKKVNRDTYVFFPQKDAPISLFLSDIDFITPIDTLISSNAAINTSNADRLRKVELQVNDLYNRL